MRTTLNYAFLAALAGLTLAMTLCGGNAAMAMSSQEAKMGSCDTGYAAYVAANPIPDGVTKQAAYRAYLSACLKTATPPVVTPPDPAPTPDPDNPTPSHRRGGK